MALLGATTAQRCDSGNERPCDLTGGDGTFTLQVTVRAPVGPGHEEFPYTDPVKYVTVGCDTAPKLVPGQRIQVEADRCYPDSVGSQVSAVPPIFEQIPLNSGLPGGRHVHPEGVSCQKLIRARVRSTVQVQCQAYVWLCAPAADVVNVPGTAPGAVLALFWDDGCNPEPCVDLYAVDLDHTDHLGATLTPPDGG